MALLTIDHFSESLGLSMSCMVILPQDTAGQIGMTGSDSAAAGGRYPTLRLLHGRRDDHTMWLRRTNIDRYAAPLGLAVVTPEVHLSRYSNMAYGGCYWDYISREQRYVAGLSMGGWGTMKPALNQPERHGGG